MGGGADRNWVPALPSVTTKHTTKLNLQDADITYICVVYTSISCNSYILTMCTVKGGGRGQERCLPFPQSPQNTSRY